MPPRRRVDRGASGSRAGTMRGREKQSMGAGFGWSGDRLTSIATPHKFRLFQEEARMRGAVTAALALAAFLGMSQRVLAADDVIATVGDTKITKSQVEDHVRAQLIAVENQRYEALKDGLDGMIADAPLGQEAKKQGTSPEALEKKVIDDKVGEPTDAEIQKVYDDNKAQLGGQTLEQVKPRIVQYLKQQKDAARRTAYLDELRKKYPTTVSLRPPV